VRLKKSLQSELLAVHNTCDVWLVTNLSAQKNPARRRLIKVKAAPENEKGQVPPKMSLSSIHKNKSNFNA